MKIAISMRSLQGPLLRGELSVSDFIKYTASLGAQGVELLEREMNAEEIQAVLTETGLKACYTLGCHLNNIEKVKEGLWLASSLRASCAVVMGPKDQKPELPERLASVLLASVLPLAQELNIVLCVENQGYSEYEHKTLHQLLAKLDNPYLKSSFHLANTWLAGEEPLAVLEALGEYLGHVRLTDVRPVQNGEVDCLCHNHRGECFVSSVLGLGEVPVAKLLQLLQERGYTGWITLEFMGLENPFFGIEASLKNLRQSLASTITGGWTMKLQGDVEVMDFLPRRETYVD